MPADLAASTYLVDGIDLQTTDAWLTHDGAGLWASTNEDVGVSTSAGVNGGTIAGGVFRPFSHGTMFRVEGADHDTTWAAVVALRRRCKPGQTVTLTRFMPDPDGTDSNISHVTTGRRLSDRVVWANHYAVDVDIDWLITGGPWRPVTPTVIASAAGTPTVLGDLPTSYITATLSAGAVNPIVTNASNGYSFRYVGTVPAGGVEVDVMTRRATRVSDSVDVSSLLRWTKAAPFQLDPGSNDITVSTGTCALSYYPAYQ